MVERGSHHVWGPRMGQDGEADLAPSCAALVRAGSSTEPWGQLPVLQEMFALARGGCGSLPQHNSAPGRGLCSPQSNCCMLVPTENTEVHANEA